MPVSASLLISVKPHAAIGALKHVETKPLSFDWSIALTQSATIQARDYWLSRRGNGAMPARADLSPHAMKAFMPHLGLIEVREAPSRRDYLIRLAGSRWEDVFGPMRAKLLGDFLPKHIEDRWRLLFDSVCDAKKPVRVTTRIAFKEKTWLAAEMFVAPLSDDGTSVSMLFLCFASWSTVKRSADGQ